MDEHTNKLLEYDRLLEALADRAVSDPGKDFCLALEPDLSREDIEESWARIQEAKEILYVDGPPPLEELRDITPILDRLAVENMVLRPQELTSLFQVIATSRKVKNYLQSNQIDVLSTLVEALPVLYSLETDIERSIAPDGEVLDTASAELARLRRDSSSLRGDIQKRLTWLMRQPEARNALQDEIVTRRSGRYVIPLKNSTRSDVPGLVHDYSSSGATAYVEPFEMVEDNNKLNLIRRQEKREVERILRSLSAQAAKAAPLLEEALVTLVHLDCIFAQASFSRAQKSCAPRIDDTGIIDLRQARHPLLLAREGDGGRRAVAIDLRIENDNRVLIVSGINAGGKTVALKTLGLLVLMVRTGLHIPVEENSRIFLFDRVVAVIGDDQDMQSDRSTFSGHVRRLAWVLSVASENGLILLDELGTGTDPAEGAALALAVLDALRKKGAWVMTATHYHMLKAWAHLTEGATNAAVRTDSTGRPIFGLHYGSPGFSAGLAMARDMGLDADVVDQAETYLDEGQKKTIDLMQKLEWEKAALHESRETCETLESELAAALARTRIKERERREAHQALLKDLGQQVKKAIQKAENDFQDLKKKMKNRAARPQSGPFDANLAGRFRGVKEELRSTVAAPVVNYDPIRNIRPGDKVLVVTLGKEGRVASIDADRDRIEVEVGGMVVQTRMDGLARPGQSAKAGQTRGRISVPLASEVPREINLLGLTVEEALPMVEKSLDQALLGGVKHFNIIHGVGTGRLRKAVRGYLSEQPQVKCFQRADRRMGGEGVTTVELV